MSTTSPTRRSTTGPIIVAVVALLVAAVAVVAGRDGDAPAAARPTSSATGADDPLAGLARRAEGDPLAQGRVDAPVVMVAYSEFQCPFCGKFARDTEPTLVRKYVDRGVLRIEWRDFPYLGDESQTAALAGRAAALQGRFWQFHDALFADQQPVNGGRITPAFLAGVATRAGLDGDRLLTDMKRPELAAAIRSDSLEGQSLGVTGTPAFIINGQPVIGAQPTSVFEQVIDAAAAAAR